MAYPVMFVWLKVVVYMVSKMTETFIGMAPHTTFWIGMMAAIFAIPFQTTNLYAVRSRHNNILKYAFNN